MIDFNFSPVFCAHNGVVLLEKSEMGIVVGMLDITNEELCSKIKSSYAHYCIGKDCEKTTSVVFQPISNDFFIKETSRQFSLHQGGLLQVEKTKREDTSHLDYMIEDAPIIHLLNSLLLECIARDGSDIHIEPFEDGARVKMRVLGEIGIYSLIDSQTAKALVLRILFLASLDITETRKGQDGSFHFEAGSTKTDVRVSVLPTQFGLSCVLRILSCKSFELTIDGLGFSPTAKEFLESICRKASSLVLVCGATGAGKSTTLAAILHKISGENLKIITIEDPIEYRIDGAVQIAVNIDVDMDFSDILRSSFRHDPDVIMVGEIRDEKTARIAVRAALTGHLVLASIHTIDAPSAIIRLLDMGIENWLLSSVFGGSICQRLIKKTEGSSFQFIPIAEVLPASVEVSNLIIRKACLYEYRNWMIEQNIKSIAEEEEYALCI